MPVNLCEQTLSFVASFATGLIMSFIYDLYGAVRHAFNIKNKVIFIFDSLFFVLLSVAFFAALYITSGGKLRWFVIAGLIFGLLLYIIGVGSHVRIIAEKFLLFFATVLKKIMHTILLPLKHIFNFFCNIFFRIAIFVKPALKKSLFLVKNTIENVYQFIIKLVRYIVK